MEGKTNNKVTHCKLNSETDKHPGLSIIVLTQKYTKTYLSI